MVSCVDLSSWPSLDRGCDEDPHQSHFLLPKGNDGLSVVSRSYFKVILGVQEYSLRCLIAL